MFRRHLAQYCAAVPAPKAASAKRPLLNFSNTHGFTLKSTRRIDELNLVGYEWTHDKTGALYYHIDTNDRNNTFCIGFRTPAANSKGTSHVLEHTVLCGSKKYPVRDPFFMMLRRSLSTFMNAMTGADYTLYPFATTNNQDFHNLLDVYMDAVLHPLLRVEDFHQEGHRVTLESTESSERRLVFNGVVYNEMRGVVSEPSQHYAHSLMKAVLPGTHYVHISGGYPPDILTLTHEELVAFHRRHYHPSNSMIFSYGDQHPEKCMKVLDSYFSSFSRGEVVTVPTLPPTERFASPQEITLQGPLNPMGNPRQQKRVSVTFAVQQEDNALEDVVSLTVLDSLLSSGPSSPLYQALIESQIGSRYAPMRGYSGYLSTPIISYGVEGVDEDRPDASREVLSAVEGTLRRVARDGFDERRVRSVVFQEELQQRHRPADYGVSLCTALCAMGLCRAGDSPLDLIDWLPHLRRIGEQRAASLLPRITRNLLDNPHRALVAVSAHRDHLNHLRDDLAARETRLNADANDETKERVAQETEQWLERVRAPQDSELLPTLTVADIPRAAFQEPSPLSFQESTTSGVFVIPCATNGLVYVHGLAPFSAALRHAIAAGSVPTDVPLQHALFGALGAGPHSYKDLSVETELVCGGFRFAAELNPSYKSNGNGRHVLGTTYGFYTTRDALRAALALLRTVLMEPRVSAACDEVRSRALSLAKSHCTAAVQRLQRSGHRVAASLAASRLTRRGAIQEQWHGLSHAKSASALLDRLQSPQLQGEAIAEVLEAHAVATRALANGVARGALWATCDAAHSADVAAALTEFQQSLLQLSDVSNDNININMSNNNINNKKKEEGDEEEASTRLTLGPMQSPLTAATGTAAQRLKESLPIDTSYVGAAVSNALHWRHPHQAALRVACQLLSNEYLHRRVREEGGAYGCSAAATLSGGAGGVTMTSYRDPTPEQTAVVFAEAAEWVGQSANITQRRVDEAKLRIFASIDAPYAADSFGEAFFLHEITAECKQELRDALLAVEPKDVVNAAQYLRIEGGDVAAVVSMLCPEEGGAAEEK